MTTKGSITRNVIDSYFEELDDTFCSLGQDTNYYVTIRDKIEQPYRDEIFSGLRDAAINKQIGNKFKNTEIFRVSLLRFSQAEKAFKEAKKIMARQKVNKVLKFTFTCKVPHALKEHVVKLDFVDSNEEYQLPSRINAFVGKNATGKTKVLTELASQLSGATGGSKTNFKPERPSFSKVIAISYSAFDELYKPFDENNSQLVNSENKSRKDQTVLFSYVYCGLRTKKGILSLDDIEESFFKAYQRLIEKNREEKWIKIMSNVFEDEHFELIDRLMNREADSDERLSVFLSSGQNILLSTMTEVISNIENDSLILFDEPEIHLHPNAIANFMRMFYDILIEFDSYAVISTHSPLIIQEIPSKYVRVFNRSNNIPFIETLYSECFGENISTITNDVFDVREHESNYKTWFRKMSGKFSKDEIIDLFDGELSYNALTFLNSLFYNKERVDNEGEVE